MTARPLDVEQKLRRQELRATGGQGSALARLPFVVIVDNVRSLWNVGSIFRTADACGVRELALCGISGCPPRQEITKTALGAEEAVAWSYRAEPLAALHRFVEEGYTPVALETSDRAASLDAIDWPSRICLVVGNEVAGISEPVLDACELHVSIPMYGAKDSLNVAVAFGIVAHRTAGALIGNEATG